MTEDKNSFIEDCKTFFEMNAEDSEKVFLECGKLPDGTASLSSKAMHKILPFLETGKKYHNACSLAGYDFNNIWFKGERMSTLPYYGAVLKTAVLGGNTNFDAKTEPEKHYGKINNPTVHVALNQLRKVYNKLVEVYGKPDRIVIESARDLPLGEKGLKEKISEQAKNRKKNEEISEELKKLHIENNAENRMRYKLWEDLNSDPVKRMCPFCGRNIERSKLFSSDFEIEHLLPFSQTFDDTRANKVISCTSCNRIQKGARSPYDAFANRTGYNWNDIMGRVSAMPKSKQWRFRPDAWKIFEEKYGDFIARMLNDTRYMSKIAREYLSAVIEPKNILTVPGSITALLRGKWGLNAILDGTNAPEEAKKNRDDNRHHAIDAFVISCLNQKLISMISECAKRAEAAHLDRILKTIPTPYKHISYDKIEDMVQSIVVSHKLDRGNARDAARKGSSIAKLHNDTAQGKIGEEVDGKITLAKRVPILSIEFKQNSIEQIANLKIRNDLMDLYKTIQRTCNKENFEKEWKAALNEYCTSNKIRRIRIHTPNHEISKLIPISDKSGKVYKYMDNAESYCMDIYQTDSNEWKFEVINMFAAHKNTIPNWRKMNPHAKLIMRLFKRDTIAYEEDGKYKLAVVRGLATHGQISLVPLNVGKIEGNPPKKMPSSLKSIKAHKVYIDEIGRIFDPYKKNE